LRLAEEGFHTPPNLVDRAARLYNPIVRGEADEDLCECFLKDYGPSNW
jgi:hypothetical protein